MKVLVAGDYCDTGRVSKMLAEGDFSFFDNLKTITSRHDVSIVNFEFPIATNKDVPIRKQGPILKGKKESVDAIKYAGFNVCTLANNHILDCGYNSAINTKKVIEANNIKTCGFGNDLADASKILYIKVKNETLAIVNCCEHEFSIATDGGPGANPLNPIQQYYSIRRARKEANYVLVIVHGGHELFPLPSPRMKELYEFFINAGADSVINHHQHCFSGFELCEGKPVFYGLGNLLYDRGGEAFGGLWNYGYMVSINLGNNNNSSFDIIPYKQCIDKPTIEFIKKEDISKEICRLNLIISDEVGLKKEVDTYYKKCINDSQTLFEPIWNKYLNYLQRKGVIPSFISKKKLTKIQNCVLCESHRDKLSFYFNSIDK